MSKFAPQDITEENSIKILDASYDSKFFLFQDWGIKDRYPDIDGQIRLRHITGIYLDKYLHYQLKGVKNVKGGKYFCGREILKYLIETNVPTILFVVDTTVEKTYWYYLDKKKVAELNLTSDNKGRTLDLNGGELNKSNSAEINNYWQKIAKKDSYNELNESLSKIVADFHQNVRKCVGLLYLLQRVEKNKLSDLFSNLLSIKTNEVDVIIDKLKEQKIISETSQLYLVENEQIGIECLFDLVGSFDLDSLKKVFKEKEDLSLINKHLAQIKHPKVESYFKNQFTYSLETFTNPTNNDVLIENLELLGKFSFRNPKVAMQILETVIKPKKLIPAKKYRTPYSYTGGSYRDVLSKVIARLDDLRFLETKKVLKHLLLLSKKKELVVTRELDDLIEHIAQYNIHALKIIGYKQQITIVNELEKLTNLQLKDHYDVILKLGKELLEPSFEGSLSDARTINFTFGPLSASATLLDIRSRTIKLLLRIFNLLTNDKSKVEVVKTLSVGMHTPTQGNYTDALEDLVRTNIEEIVAFYIKILDSARGLLTQEIEEQVNFLIERHKSKPLKLLPELEAKIASSTEYNLFRTFVGYDFRIAKKDNWEAEKEERSKKIDSFVDDISEKNIQAWLKKIKSVINEYEDTDSSKFQYFFIFLSKLGQQKPEIAVKLIKENEDLFQKFLIHILGGVFDSAKGSLADELVIKWVNKNKNVTSCAVILASSKRYNKKLFQMVANKAIQGKNIQASNNIIRGTTVHYSADHSLKKIFIQTINKLTEIQDTSWVYSRLWFKNPELLKTLKVNQIKAVLRNLTYSPDVNHDVEEILMDIVEAYPEEVMFYFHKRLLSKTLHKSIKRYEVLPYNLNELDKKLREHTPKIIPILFSWLESTDDLTKLRAANFFETLFEEFSPELEEALIKIIKSGDAEKAKQVLLVLNSFKGQKFLHKTILEYVKQYPMDKETKQDLFIALSVRGTTTGEYGIYEAYKQKKDEMQDWKSQKDPKVLAFAKEYEKYLDDTITFEKTRADDMVAMFNKRVD